jgi:hypothetical protein
MSTYTPDELLGLWTRQELSILQAIGHLLQHLVRQQREIEALKRRPTKSDQQTDQPS